jgi:hypothetical protein
VTDVDPDTKREVNVLVHGAVLRTGPNAGRHSDGPFGAGKGLRPSRRPNLYLLAERRAEASGLSLEEELWQVVLALFAAAKKGDIQAAKILLDKLTLPDVLALQVSAHAELTDTERVSRLRALIDSVRLRIGVDDLLGDP